MARVLEHSAAKNSALSVEEVISRPPAMPKTGGLEPDKQPRCPQDDKQMQKLLKHCCGAIAAQFAEWRWYAK
jgi:hypothetical protein